MPTFLIIIGIIVIGCVGIFTIINLIKSQPEKEFEKYFISGEFEKTQKVFQQATIRTGFPPLSLGLRQLVFLITQKASSEEIMALGKKIFRFHPNISYAHLKNSAFRMGVPEEPRLKEYFRNIEFTYMAELISGAIPDYPSPEDVRKFINKRGTGIVLGSKYLENSDLQSKVIYQKSDKFKIGVGPRLEELINPHSEVRLTSQKASENKQGLKIDIEIKPATISTNSTDLLSAFDMAVPEVHTFMNSLGQVDLEDFFRWKTLYGNTSLRNELSEVLKKKYFQMVSGMALFIHTRHLSDSISEIEISIHEQMPFFWREKQSKDHFIGNYVEHQFKIHILNGFAFGALKYKIPLDLLVQDYWNYYKKLEKEIEPLISITTI